MSAPKIQVSIVGLYREAKVEWPEGWPVPPEGARVDIGFKPLFVRSVTWYPQGDTEIAPEPFVYVVLGDRRPL